MDGSPYDSTASLAYEDVPSALKLSRVAITTELIIVESKDHPSSAGMYGPDPCHESFNSKRALSPDFMNRM